MDSITVENVIFYGLIAFVAVDTAWELYLTYRQIRVYKTTSTLPETVRNIFRGESLEKSRSYALDNAVFSAFTIVYSGAIAIYTLYRHSLYAMWSFAVDLAASLGSGPEDIYPIMCFMIINGLISTLLTLPLTIFYIFVIEEKHGFNKQSFSFFMKDGLKVILLEVVFFVSILGSVIYIINHAGPNIHLWLWSFAFLVMLFMVVIFPKYVDPSFNKFTPLPEGALRSSIEQLASSVNFPLSQIYVVDGSTRSGHENAYFTGILGSKRIILYDTLLEEVDGHLRYENDEILAILCHELGHWKHGHIYSMITLTQITELFTFMLVNALMEYSPLYRAFGFPPGEEPSIIGSIIIQQYVLAPYHMVLDLMFTHFTRTNEFQADEFAVKMKLGRQLKSALLKISHNNLTFPVDDWLFAMWNIDHPTLIERIHHIDSIKD